MSALGSLPSRGSVVVAGSRRTRAYLTTQLSGAGWDVVETGDLNRALHHVRRLQPDVVAIELPLSPVLERLRGAFTRALEGSESPFPSAEMSG